MAYFADTLPPDAGFAAAATLTRYFLIRWAVSCLPADAISLTIAAAPCPAFIDILR